MPRILQDQKALLDHLDNLNFFHMDLSLSRMECVLGAMGLRRPPYYTIQVAGTNGKGSTAAFLSSLFRAHGLRVGLYTSPHFHEPAERVRVDDALTALEGWLEPANEAVSLCPELTYFELITVVALAVFRHAKVDVAVLEAGLGARYDATTATAADGVVFTPVALDHVALLGSNTATIASEKSYAIRSQAPVISSRQEKAVMDVLRRRCEAFHAPLVVADPVHPGTRLGLAGEHQLGNAGTAVTALRELAPRLPLVPNEECIARGLAGTFLPGRLQTIPGTPSVRGLPPRPVCILDGAHNPHGMASLTRALTQRIVPAPAAVVYSCLADKDWRVALEELLPAVPGAVWLVPAIPGERSEQPAVVADFLRGRGVTQVSVFDNTHAAFEALAGSSVAGAVLVTGSLYLLGAFYDLWPETLSVD